MAVKRFDVPRTIVLMQVLTGGLGGALSFDATFERINLADVSYYEPKCPPQVLDMPPSRAGSSISCAMRCLANTGCSFFSVPGNACWLWSFPLDASYNKAVFSVPTVLSYRPRLDPSSFPTDVAIGKPVTWGSNHTIYAQAPMLTRGSWCLPNGTDCYGSLVQGNWATVDLLQSLPVTRVTLTAPAGSKIDFFYNIVVRAGNTGTKSDPKIGVTPMFATDNQVIQFKVSGSVRYVRIQNEAELKSILVCKLQAFL
ncbi:uncharacterized protein LOC108667974 [Hyalella azteca]|uniref:Uncharacterized protein LOC108667974 n=1 Tax=Hyalella azteca TaxID=294128 RepID=A0A979FTA9_HYAAZ|nr:uncharacterized protein LOC108667974 [Hyalella azteca]